LEADWLSDDAAFLYSFRSSDEMAIIIIIIVSLLFRPEPRIIRKV